MSAEVEITPGIAFVFDWFGRELTGVCISSKGGWARFRTKKSVYAVPWSDVLRQAPEEDQPGA